MPLALGEGDAGRGWGSFDLGAASTLFARAVPVAVRLEGRPEQGGHLVLRILSGTSRASHSCRVSNADRPPFPFLSPFLLRILISATRGEGDAQVRAMGLVLDMVEGRERCWGRVGEVHCCLLQVLSIHIFSEEDLLFLNTLEVSEEEFQVLKAEQGILVDFAHFPGKVISLLEKCVQAGLSAKPRCAFWLCVLWQQCLCVARCVIQTCQEQPSGC